MTKEVYIVWTADSDTLTIFGVYTKEDIAKKSIEKLRSLGIPAVYAAELVDQPLQLSNSMLEGSDDEI